MLPVNDMNDPIQGHPLPTLDETLDLLRAAEGEVIGAPIVYGLDSLTADQLRALWPVWQELDVDVRRRVILALTESGETNFELDFSEIGQMALADDAPAVRVLAVDLLWEDESPALLDMLLIMARDDDSVEVRASAASALGRFALMGELGGLSADAFERVQDRLLDIIYDAREDVEVRRRALEAVSNSSHESIEDAVTEAYQSDDQRMRVSALFAMGRTADQRWAGVVLNELESDEPEMRFEAARAAGELELDDATPLLAELAFEGDVEMRDAAIWSLGEIGGKDALRVLNVMSEEAREGDDEDLLGALEDAIAAASLGRDSDFYLMRLDDEE